MKKFDKQGLFRGAAALICLALMLRWPQQSARGIQAGLASCAGQVIPALFPFFVVSSLIVASPLAEGLGLALYPITRFGLGLREKQAGAALLISWLGGFAVAASTISQLYRQGRLDQRGAALLLVCGVGSGPAFIVNTVGLLMLGSASVGFCLLGALLCANLCTGIIFRFLAWILAKSGAFPPDKPTNFTGKASQNSPRKAESGFVAAVGNAVSSMLTVCGFVVFFRFLCTVLGQSCSLPQKETFLLNALLEVTSGCAAASQLTDGTAVTACCIALSIQSLSVCLQVRALLCAELPLWPLLAARPVHLAFSLLFLPRFLALLPGAADVVSTLAPTVIPTTRTAPDTALVLFALCCVVLYRLDQSRRSGRRKAAQGRMTGTASPL